MRTHAFAYRYACVFALAFTAMLVVASSAFASGGTTYSQTQTLAVPPASSFTASAGGDGWSVSLSTDQVYNVFHHDSQLYVNCHKQLDGSACWASGAQLIQDGFHQNFWSSGHPSVYVDQATGKLYIYATSTHDSSAGVVCVDPSKVGTGTPFCGYTELTSAGDAYMSWNWSAVSAPMLVGQKLYAYNYFGDGVAHGVGSAKNSLLCFDVSTQAACAGQPFHPNMGPTTYGQYAFGPAPATVAIGNRLILPFYNYGLGYGIGCYDTSTGADCAGSWPINTSAAGYTYAGHAGGAFPLMNNQGTTIGFCVPYNGDPCWAFDGSKFPIIAGLGQVITNSDGWNGPSVTIGPRVYVPNGNTNNVQCFDYTTQKSCTNFPKSFPNLGYLYTVNSDFQRPTCLWVNADNGAWQIQSFDAYTGGACGAGSARVLTSQFVVNQQNCYPTSYKSLAVTSPAPGSYTSGTVQFADAAGNPIPGVPTVSLDSNGVADLSSLGFAAGALPQYIITLTGASTTQLTVKLTWGADYDPACVAPGTDVTKTATTTSTMLSDGSTTSNTLSVINGTPVFDAAAVTGDQAGKASGSVTYTFYSDSTCTTVASAQTLPIGTPGSVPPSTGAALPVGKYWVVASYSGDAGNEPSTSACGDELLDVKSPDSTPPVTTNDAPAGWQTAATTVTLTATDDESGVAATYYAIDGGATQTGNTVLVTGDGTHTITYWSVDNDGNIETAKSVGVDIDGGAPTITSARSAGPNANGWNNADVTVTFTCADAVSGIKSCSAPQTFGEGTNQSVTGTAVDNAGNTASATESPINVDETAPTLTGAPTTDPNGNGWYSGDVTVHWTCADDRSGVDGACPADSTITGEGSGLSATQSIADLAGNTTTKTVTVNVDRTAPSTTASAPSGWLNGPATVTLTATDGLSGVAATYYSIDGGSTATGTTVNLATQGTHTVTYWSVDKAGNIETANSVGVNIDLTPPTISGARSAQPNAYGWNNTDVTVTFTCGDDLSGVASCPASQTFGEGAAQSASGTAADNAGNTASATVAPINVDKTAPVVTAAADRAPNANGWYRGPVTVTYTCTDGLSGVADCPAAQSFTQGTAQSASGTGHDKAGNAASASVTNINVDTTAPTLAPTVSPNAILLFGTATVTPNAADAGGSGLDTVTCGSVDTSTVGTKTVSCTATDKAGNTTTATATYSVYSALSYKQDALSRINALIPNASKLDAKSLSDAAAKLQDALLPTYWVDGIHLQPSGGVHVFNGEKQAIDKLNGIAGTQPIIGELANADRILASVAISDAIAGHGNAALIASAQAAYAQGNTALANGQYASGVAQLMNAWQYAEQAVGKL